MIIKPVLRRVILRPFTDLSSFERALQYIRLISSLFIIIAGLVLTLGARLNPARIYMGRLDTLSINISKGLFSILESNVVGAASTVNDGLGLTDSEVNILTQYISGQIGKVPRYITASMYAWCEFEKKHHDTFCHQEGIDYYFNYKSVLDLIGLDIVLQYAFPSTSTDTGYSETFKSRKPSMVATLYVAIILEFIILGGSLYFYSIKGRKLNRVRERFIVHGLCLVSFVVLILCVVSLGNLFAMSLKIKSSVTEALAGFGLTYHLGRIWFVALWIMLACALVSCIVWSGMEWCVVMSHEASIKTRISLEQEEIHLEDYEESFMERAKLRDDYSMQEVQMLSPTYQI